MDKKSRAIEQLEKSSFDAIVLSSPENFYYLSDVRLLMQRLIPSKPGYLVLTRDGTLTMLTAASDRDHALRDGTVSQVIPFKATESPERLLAEVLSDLGLHSGHIGIDSNMTPCDTAWFLDEALEGIRLGSATRLMERARMVKTEEEISLLERAEHRAELALGAALSMVRPGESEVDIASRVAANMMRMGAESVDFVLLTIGENSLKYHYPPGDRIAMVGDIIHVDTGASFNSYRADISRNVGIRTLTDKQKDVYRRLWEVQRQIIAQIRPGRLVADICEDYRCAMKELDLTPPSLHVGHGIGLDSHEFPELTPDCEVEIEPGMVLAIEPTTFIDDDARYDIEDTVVVTEDGCRMLSGDRHSSDIRVV